MPLDYSISLDLTGSLPLTEEKLLAIKKLVSLKPIPVDLKETLVEILESQPKGKLEIYIEELDLSDDSEEDIQDFVAEIDEEIVPFSNGSTFIWTSNYPLVRKTFEKNGFTWDYSEESDYDEDLDLPSWDEYE